MAIEVKTGSAASPTLRANHVYAMAGICLAAGLAIGYVMHGPQSAGPSAIVSSTAVMPGGASTPTAGMQMPNRRISSGAPNGMQSPEASNAAMAHSADQIKQVADKQIAEALAKLKSDPKNVTLLSQVGALYHATHRFTEAAEYYGQALQVDPKNVALRTKLSGSLYYGGDVDGAIAQLNQSLALAPNDANSLFNLGLIKLQGKQDSKGALAAWRQLLKTNPDLSPERKATVQKLMANVLSSAGEQQAVAGAQGK